MLGESFLFFFVVVFIFEVGLGLVIRRRISRVFTYAGRGRGCRWFFFFSS